MIILPVNNTVMNSVTYVLYAEDVDYCILIDCGQWDTLKPVLDSIGKRVKTVLLTHGHSDHISGLIGLLTEEPSLVVGTNVAGHEELANPRKNLSFYHGTPSIVEGYVSLILQDGMTIHFEGIADVDVIATPGHSSSCLTYKVGKDLFTGDAYIPGLKTFTKFPRGNKDLAIQSISILKNMEHNGCHIHCGHHSYENIQ